MGSKLFIINSFLLWSALNFKTITYCVISGFSATRFATRARKAQSTQRRRLARYFAWLIYRDPFLHPSFTDPGLPHRASNSGTLSTRSILQKLPQAPGRRAVSGHASLTPTRHSLTSNRNQSSMFATF